MIKLLTVCGAALLAGMCTCPAQEFPLQFKTIEAKDVMRFPGGYGSYGQIRIKKPDGLKAEPKAACKRPLYGKIGENMAGSETWLFRLDESQGDGKGYDQLIVDLNQNGDLTDDPVAGRVVTGEERDYPTNGPEFAVFGPMESKKSINGHHPIYFAQAYIYARMYRNQPEQQNAYLGQVRFKAGWYLETTVALGSLKKKVGVYDANSNQQLGELSKCQTYSSSNEPESWYFSGGDSFLCDVDDSGKFDNDSFGTENTPFGPILYFGSEPYQVALAADNSSLKVERWTEALAEVALQPQGQQVARIGLARETAPGKWQLMEVGSAGGKIKVPPANYRLYSCQLQVQTAQGEPLAAQGFQRNTKPPQSFKVGSGNTLKCGAPLQIQLEAEKRKPESWEMSQLPGKANPAVDSEFILAINATVSGQGGEIYSTYGQGKGLREEPSKPTFTIANAKGERIANGNLEFG